MKIKDGEFCWDKESGVPTLEGVNISLKKGQLFGVLGRVGSGKVGILRDLELWAVADGCLQSSLLSAMIGDMRRTEGEVVVSGNVAYAPQNPW